MDYWLCVSVCLCVSVFSRERYNVQMLRASLSETSGVYDEQKIGVGDVPHYNQICFYFNEGAMYASCKDEKSYFRVVVHINHNHLQKTSMTLKSSDNPSSMAPKQKTFGKVETF